MQAHNPERQFAAPIRKAPVKWMYDQLGGQVMTVAWALLSLGTALALFDKLTGEWIALAGIIQALVTFRAIGEDKYVVSAKMTTPR